MSHLYGLDAAKQRNTSFPNVIGGIETTSGGDTLVAFGNTHLDRYGEVGRFHESAVVRLTPADRDRLIDALQLARMVDTAGGAR